MTPRKKDDDRQRLEDAQCRPARQEGVEAGHMVEEAHHACVAAHLSGKQRAARQVFPQGAAEKDPAHERPYGAERTGRRAPHKPSVQRWADRHQGDEREDEKEGQKSDGHVVPASEIGLDGVSASPADQVVHEREGSRPGRRSG